MPGRKRIRRWAPLFSSQVFSGQPSAAVFRIKARQDTAAPQANTPTEPHQPSSPVSRLQVIEEGRLSLGIRTQAIPSDQGKIFGEQVGPVDLGYKVLMAL